VQGTNSCELKVEKWMSFGAIIFDNFYYLLLILVVVFLVSILIQLINDVKNAITKSENEM
jgi:hypothetical protein